MSSSLIKPPAAQPSLFADDAVPSNDPVRVRLEDRGEFSGDRLFAQQPDKYRRVVWMLGQGFGTLKIAGELQVSRNTVKAIRKREGETIDLVKQRLGDLAHDVAETAWSEISELLQEILNDPKRRREITVKDLKDLGLLGAMATDKGQLLAGEATHRLELSNTGPTFDDFNDVVASAKPINSGREKSAQKGREPMASARARAKAKLEAHLQADQAIHEVDAEIVGPPTDDQAEGPTDGKSTDRDT